jgi:hypothetical protein
MPLVDTVATDVLLEVNVKAPLLVDTGGAIENEASP